MNANKLITRYQRRSTDRLHQDLDRTIRSCECDPYNGFDCGCGVRKEAIRHVLATRTISDKSI